MKLAVAIVRHASAGDRTAWRGDDALRPLDEKGTRQAAAIAGLLAARRPVRIASSPAIRCLRTVGPLVQATGVPLEALPELAEGEDPEPADLLKPATGSPVVLCSHGDVIGRLIGFDRPCRKGSIWLCEWDGELLAPHTYIRKA